MWDHTSTLTHCLFNTPLWPLHSYRQWRLLMGGWLIIMSGNHMVDTIPYAPFQPLWWAILSSASSTGHRPLLDHYCNGGPIYCLDGLSLPPSLFIASSFSHSLAPLFPSHSLSSAVSLYLCLFRTLSVSLPPSPWGVDWAEPATDNCGKVSDTMTARGDVIDTTTGCGQGPSVRSWYFINKSPLRRDVTAHG